MPVIEHVCELLIFVACFNFVGFRTDISAPESTRKVHSECVDSVFRITKFDRAVEILKIPFIFVDACLLMLLGSEVVVVAVVAVGYFDFGYFVGGFLILVLDWNCNVGY